MSTKKRKNAAQKAIDLDGLYPPAITAEWMGISTRTLLDLAKEGKVPVARLNARVLRFNPRTILAKVA
jgi:predicted site-specific integrase-resolvase